MMNLFRGTRRTHAGCMLKGLVGAVGLGMAASAYADVTLLLAVEITDVSTTIPGASGGHGLTHFEVGDVFLVSVVYDETVTGTPSGSIIEFDDALSSITSPHSGHETLSPTFDCGVHRAYWSPSSLYFTAEAGGSNQSVWFIDQDQDYSRNELPACISLDDPQASFEIGYYLLNNLYANSNYYRISGDVVGIIEGNCTADGRSHAIADWELEPPYGVGDDTMKVRLKGVGTLGSVGNASWNALGGAPEPVDAPDNSIDAIVELPPGSHTYELVVSNANQSHTTVDAVTIDIADESEPDCPADQNFDGQLTPADFTAWINNYNMGC